MIKILLQKSSTYPFSSTKIFLDHSSEMKLFSHFEATIDQRKMESMVEIYLVQINEPFNI